MIPDSSTLAAGTSHPVAEQTTALPTAALPAMTLGELADRLGGRLVDTQTASVPLVGAKPIHEAGPGELTFLDGDKNLPLWKSCRAAAVLVNPRFIPPEGCRAIPRLEVDDPLMAFAEAVLLFRRPPPASFQGIHPQAIVAQSARLGENVTIHPGAVIGERVELGENVVIHPGAVVQDDCKLGRDCVIHPRAVLYPGVILGDRVVVHAGAVLGGDGFGYRFHQGRHLKVPQLGGLVVGDDVEIGCNTTIDRGTFGDTKIGAGTKIDNLVQIGHNTSIGRHNLICGLVGIAGSCATGDHVVLAGQVGLRDHITIGSRAVIGAQAGVSRDIKPDASVVGSPAIPDKEFKAIYAASLRLPRLPNQLREIFERLDRLEASSLPSKIHADVNRNGDADAGSQDNPPAESQPA